MSYVIPEHIFASYKIVTSEILGKKHYGLERVYEIFGFKFKRLLKVYDGIGDNKRITSSASGHRWHQNIRVIEIAIRNDRSKRIENYIDKHVK